jgi:hypothetical protein
VQAQAMGPPPGGTARLGRDGPASGEMGPPREKLRHGARRATREGAESVRLSDRWPRPRVLDAVCVCRFLGGAGGRFRAKGGGIKRIQGLLPGSQGQESTWTVLCVAHWPGSGDASLVTSHKEGIKSKPFWQWSYRHRFLNITGKDHAM